MTDDLTAPVTDMHFCYEIPTFVCGYCGGDLSNWTHLGERIRGGYEDMANLKIRLKCVNHNCPHVDILYETLGLCKISLSPVPYE
jgi:hypothetical protein